MTTSDSSTSKLPAILRPTADLLPPPTEAEFEAALAKGAADVRAAGRAFQPSARRPGNLRYP